MERELQDTDGMQLRTLGQMATYICHEIRNSLSSVKMNLQILADRLQPGGDIKEHFGIALREVNYLEELLQEILEFIRPLKLKQSWEEIDEILEEALLLVEKELREKRIVVQKMYCSAVPRLFLDRVRLKQAFVNIYLNAIQAMEIGGLMGISIYIIPCKLITCGNYHQAEKVRSLHTNLIHDTDCHYILIEISDNGKGVRETDLPRIFEPFFTTKDEGTGLGLPIVKNIIERHNAHIDISSREGKGAVVNLLFPVA